MEKEENVDMVELFMRIGHQDSTIDAMYRSTALSYGLTTCDMWIYYFLLLKSDGITQQTICNQIMSPKQTVNSAVQKLAKNGMLTITQTEGDGRVKLLRLTEKGETFARKTVLKLLEAELRASERIGMKKLTRIFALRDEYFRIIQEELDKTK